MAKHKNLTNNFEQGISVVCTACNDRSYIFVDRQIGNDSHHFDQNILNFVCLWLSVSWGFSIQPCVLLLARCFALMKEMIILSAVQIVVKTNKQEACVTSHLMSCGCVLTEDILLVCPSLTFWPPTLRKDAKLILPFCATDIGISFWSMSYVALEVILSVKDQHFQMIFLKNSTFSFFLPTTGCYICQSLD